MQNPYQIVGTYDGDTYIERDADHRLQRAIVVNQSYPYFCAPRQSGKSSLITHTINILPKNKYTCLLIDLSELLGDYSKYKEADDLLLAVMKYIATKLNFSIEEISCDFLEDTFSKWLTQNEQRVIIFLDELDSLIEANRLINQNFSADFLQRLRGLFNKRSDKRYIFLHKIQFILSGAAHPLHLAPDRARSPFNIGDDIPLLDLNVDQISTLANHLKLANIAFTPEIIRIIYKHTNGIVYLTRLIFREVWEKLINAPLANRILTKSIVLEIINNLCKDAVSNIHFLDIYRKFSHNDQLRNSFVLYYRNKLRNQDTLTVLLLSGVCSRTDPFRCAIYRRVFGPNGYLPLIDRRFISTNFTIYTLSILTICSIFFFRPCTVAPLHSPDLLEVSHDLEATLDMSNIESDSLSIDIGAMIDAGSNQNLNQDQSTPFDLDRIRDLGMPKHLPLSPPARCPPVYKIGCVSSKGMTSEQRQLVADRLNYLRLRICFKQRLVLLHVDNWLVADLPYPPDVSEKDIRHLLDDLYGYWRARKYSLERLPEQIIISCPRP